MRRRQFLYAAAVPALAAAAPSQLPDPLPLPKPRTQGGMPLLQALAGRKTNRNLSDEKLSPQLLSDLLWAAWGVNRPATRGRTAPSARNVQEIALYVFLAAGVYRFDAPAHRLEPVLAGDHRAKTGTQEGAGKPPVSLVYVADASRFAIPTDAVWSNAHAGFIAQNVYLFAASEGLGAWFRALVDGAALGTLLKLRPNEKVLCSQGVGYPVKG